MKKTVRLMSDLHLEFGPLSLKKIEGVDALILAGDIAVGRDTAIECIRFANEAGCPVISVAGNHEFYHGHRGQDMDSVLEELQEASESSKGAFYFLQDSYTIVNGIRFIGSTLWTDFELNGDRNRAMYVAERAMNDYRCIYQNPVTRFKPIDALAHHINGLHFITEEVKKPFDGPTVIVTHHAPSIKSIHGRYADSGYNACYASNLDKFASNSGAKLWVHGHVHHSFDYMLGNTRVKTNPRGYFRMEENRDFDPNLVVEL